MAKGAKELSLVKIMGGGALAKPEWGNKHVCLSCGAKFYDMKHVPAICPACSTKVKKSNSPTNHDTAPAKPKLSNPVKAITDGPDIEGTDGDQVLEDTNDIEENEPGIAEVLDGGVTQED